MRQTTKLRKEATEAADKIEVKYAWDLSILLLHLLSAVILQFHTGLIMMSTFSC